MVRQARHERLNLSRLKLEADYNICLNNAMLPEFQQTRGIIYRQIKAQQRQVELRPLGGLRRAESFFARRRPLCASNPPYKQLKQPYPAATKLAA